MGTDAQQDGLCGVYASVFECVAVSFVSVLKAILLGNLPFFLSDSERHEILFTRIIPDWCRERPADCIAGSGSATQTSVALLSTRRLHKQSLVVLRC